MRRHLNVVVPCLLVGAAAAHALHVSLRPPPGPEADPGPPPDAWAAVHRYGLQAAPPGLVLTDRGSPVQVFVASTQARPGADPAVRYHLRMADLVRLTPPDVGTDCHGWVFLGGRGWLFGDQIDLILADNGYRQTPAPAAGDLVVFRDADGDPLHSGLVVGAAAGGEVFVESTWGAQGRFVHRAAVPAYGRPEYYRSARPGHRLSGWDQLGPAASP